MRDEEMRFIPFAQYLAQSETASRVDLRAFDTRDIEARLFKHATGLDATDANVRYVFGAGTLWYRLTRWVGQKLCGMSGHDMLKTCEPGRRVLMRCASCGHESPGWDTPTRLSPPRVQSPTGRRYHG